jgi:hypothetical protein
MARGGKVRRWGALLLTLPGEPLARAHLCWNDWGEKLQSTRTKGEIRKLSEELEHQAVLVSSAVGAPIERFHGGSVQQFEAWMRQRFAEIPDQPIPTPDEELLGGLEWKSEP